MSWTYTLHNGAVFIDPPLRNSLCRILVRIIVVIIVICCALTVTRLKTVARCCFKIIFVFV